MTKDEIRNFAVSLSGDDLIQFMFLHMNRDIDMECSMFDPDPAMWEDYIDEIVEWGFKQESHSNVCATILNCVTSEGGCEI
jgi:hypothetical protein